METNLELLPSQFDFIEDDTRWSLIYGGRGSSKSTALCIGAYIRACVVGSCEFMCRQKLIDFKSTTLKTLLHGVGGFPPVIPPGTYSHNKELKTISIHGGGEIMYNGLDQGNVGRESGSTGKTSSMSLSGAHFDECVEMQEASVIQVCSGLRVKIDGLPMVRRFACNPSIPSNWVAKRWGLSGDHKMKANHVWRHAKPKDNWHLPDETIEELDALDGVARERYLLGKWVGSDLLAYDRWDRDIHVVENHNTPKYVIAGVDYGYSDPSVILRIHQFSGGRFHIAKEFYKPGLDHGELSKTAVGLVGDADDVVVDNAEPSLISMMQKAGVRAIPCDKGPDSIEFGVGLVQSILRPDGNGVPKLTVDPSCVNVIREFESWERKPSIDGMSDKFVDANNHAMDSLRYAIRYKLEERGLRVLSDFDQSDTLDTTPIKSFQQMRDDDPEMGW